jgi:hypothetical protein
MKYIKTFENFVYPINEYLKNQDNVALYHYFKMSEDEKKISLVYEFSYMFDKFKNKNDISEITEISDIEDWEISAVLQKDYPEIFKKFGDWLYKKIENCDIPPEEQPSWVFFDYPEIIKEQWLVHFTDNADKIVRNGFKKGVMEINKLGLTTHLSDYHKKYGGYNFAYTISDFEKYAKNTRGWELNTRGWERRKFKYGKEVVIFRCSGVRAWHHGDKEYQTIFWGNLATHINEIVSGENSEWTVRGNFKTFYENDDLEKVVDWFVNNYYQYKKQLN